MTSYATFDSIYNQKQNDMERTLCGSLAGSKNRTIKLPEVPMERKAAHNLGNALSCLPQILECKHRSSQNFGRRDMLDKS
jgi:hypothetical protein